MTDSENQAIENSNPVPTVIAVVGPFRSGTSCVAGMLHTLGVSMGNKFPTSGIANEKGFFEAMHLRRMMSQCFSWPMLESKNVSHEQLVEILKDHYSFRLTRNRRTKISSDEFDDSFLGIKHPALCLMIPEIKESCSSMKAIAITRDIESAVKSMGCAGLFPMVSPEDRTELVNRLIKTRDDALASNQIDTLKIDYADVIANPASVVDSMIKFLGITPTQDQIQAAVAFVDSSLCHYPRKELNPS